MEMELREGMFGVIVLAIAIACALFGAYLSGIEVETENYTDYEFLADVNGLYSYDKSPQFIEFDPSSNLTGYYSTTSNGHFASDKVNYTIYTDSNGNKRVNNYKVDLAPSNYSSGTYSIPNSTTGISGYNAYWGSYVNDVYTQKSLLGDKTITLSTLVTALGLTSLQTQVVLSSVQGVNDLSLSATNPTNVNWIVFSVSSSWNRSLISSALWLTDAGSLQKVNEVYGSGFVLPYLSCTIDLSSNTVNLYADKNCTGNALIGIAFSDVYVTFGGTGDTSAYLNFGNSVVYSAQSPSEKTYLDPNDGVSMKD